MHRPTLGLIAIVLLAASAALALWPTSWDGGPALQAACLRVGIVMAALWAALPQLHRIPNWFLTLGAAMAIVVAIQPRRLVILLPLLLAIWLLRPRRKA